MAMRAKVRESESPKKAPLHAVPPHTARPAIQSPSFSTEAEFKSYKNLIDRSVEVFGDELKASRWLSLPSVDLDGRVPLQVAESVHYAASEIKRIFEPIFIRIEHGIYT